MVSELSLMTTGKPISAAMIAASSALLACRVGTVGMSYASSTCFDSYSVRIVRPVWRT